jgi:PAS domain S-box-containing protein
MLEYIFIALTETRPVQHCIGLLSFSSRPLPDAAAGTLVISLVLMALALAGTLVYIFCTRNRLANTFRALQKSEARLQALGNNLPEITTFQLIHDLKTSCFRFAVIGEGAEDVVGLDRAHIMDDASLAIDHVYEEDLDRLHDAFTTAIENPSPANLEIRVLDTKGAYRWLQIMAIPQRNGQQLVWDGFICNISEKKEAELALAAATENFHNLLKGIDDFLLICNMDGQLLYTSSSLRKRLGYSEEELNFMSIFELYYTDTHREIFQQVARLQTEPSASCKHPLQTKNGACIPVEMNLFCGVWKQEKAFFGIARDVARVHQSESALRESQKMLQLIIDSIPMSIFWKDQDSIYLGCNEAFTLESRIDYPDDVVGKNPFDLFDQDIATEVLERDQNVLNTNEPLLNYSESYTKSDGSIGQREISVIPMRNDLGKALGVLGIWRDVTEQNQAAERLKRTLDDMERFNQLMRGRERRTLELKDEINALLKELNRPHKYRTTAEEIL